MMTAAPLQANQWMSPTAISCRLGRELLRNYSRELLVMDTSHCDIGDGNDWCVRLSNDVFTYMIGLGYYISVSPICFSIVPHVYRLFCIVACCSLLLCYTINLMFSMHSLVTLSRGAWSLPLVLSLLYAIVFSLYRPSHMSSPYFLFF